VITKLDVRPRAAGATGPRNGLAFLGNPGVARIAGFPPGRPSATRGLPGTTTSSERHHPSHHSRSGRSPKFPSHSCVQHPACVGPMTIACASRCAHAAGSKSPPPNRRFPHDCNGADVAYVGLWNVFARSCAYCGRHLLRRTSYGSAYFFSRGQPISGLPGSCVPPCFEQRVTCTPPPQDA
jgi:hypothetical protein